MIRLDYYVRRKPELSQEEFQARWLQDHGKLWVRHAEVLGVKRYTQLHDWPDHPVARLYRNGWGITGEAYDGVSTAYWPSYKVLEQALATATGTAAMTEILADELQLIDTSRSILSFGIVHPIINPPAKITASEENEVVRGVYFPEGLPQYDVETIQRHWIAVHGGLTCEYMVTSPNRRYLQVHAIEYPVADAMRRARGMTHGLHHFGHADVCSSEDDFARSTKNPRRQELFPLYIADIDAFADCNTGYFVVGKEFYLVDDELYALPLPQPGDS